MSPEEILMLEALREIAKSSDFSESRAKECTSEEYGMLVDEDGVPYGEGNANDCYDNGFEAGLYDNAAVARRALLEIGVKPTWKT